MISLKDLSTNLSILPAFFRYGGVFASDEPVLRRGITQSVAARKRLGSAFTILLYNIMSYDYPEKIDFAIQRIVSEHDPDIVLLNEAVRETRAPFWTRKDPYRGYCSFFAPQEKKSPHSGSRSFIYRGNLFLSPGNVAASAHYLPKVSLFAQKDLLVRNQNVVHGRVRLRGKDVGIYCTHLENAVSPSGRDEQMRALLELVSANGEDIVILAGDLNTWWVAEPCLARINSAGFASQFSGRRLSHIFVKGASATTAEVDGSGSDHGPLCVTVDVS